MQSDVQTGRIPTTRLWAAGALLFLLLGGVQMPMTHADLKQDLARLEYVGRRAFAIGLGCVSIVTRPGDVPLSVEAFGSDDGSTSSSRSDTPEEMIAILAQRSWTSPNPPNICLDFWTSVYHAIDN